MGMVGVAGKAGTEVRGKCNVGPQGLDRHSSAGRVKACRVLAGCAAGLTVSALLERHPRVLTVFEET